MRGVLFEDVLIRARRRAVLSDHPPDARSTRFVGRPRNVVWIATLCCLLWGSAYPAIKSGYALLAIGRDDTAAQLVFAGVRFVLAGLLLLGAAAFMGRTVLGVWRGRWRQLGLLGLTQTSLQYVFFYVGLAHTTGVKASILNGTGTFFSVLLAHAIYTNDRLSQRKLLGCAVGFGGDGFKGHRGFHSSSAGSGAKMLSISSSLTPSGVAGSHFGSLVLSTISLLCLGSCCCSDSIKQEHGQWHR